jgi:FkbH-like protein
MKLAEALRIIHAPADDAAPEFRAYLACGITPLHLETFLHAHLRLLLPKRRVWIEKGLFGDLTGNLSRACEARAAAAVVLIEASDLDPRLGIRQPASWDGAAAADAASGLRRRIDLLKLQLESLAAVTPVAVALPTLPLPPVGCHPSWLAAQLEVIFEKELDRLREGLIEIPGIRLLSRRKLDLVSPPGARFDAAAELGAGFPYTPAHAEALAGLLARLAVNLAPKKGIITDLDDTLWAEIAGEVGPENVRWDLEGHAQLHGLYQLTLSALSEAGTLLAVASRNDPAVVKRVFSRADLLLRPERIFPFQVHWGAKSASVAQVLKVWNIAASDAVFIDDSPMELAEVQSAHPGLECLLFPAGDARGVCALIEDLRDLCGKTEVTEEDRLRLSSIRQAHTATPEGGAEAASEEFLAGAEPRITFDFRRNPSDPRPLELINKTNQFNLNGRRLTESEWRRLLEEGCVVTLVVSYRDKFGPLGKISVLVGRVESSAFRVNTWVMSCRAFARRIEYHILQELFERFPVEAVWLDYGETDRNQPLRDFLTSLGLDAGAGSVISRENFRAACPALYHVKEIVE